MPEVSLESHTHACRQQWRPNALPKVLRHNEFVGALTF
jgi:hypothetical protein